jgi:hypothetical protein
MCNMGMMKCCSHCNAAIWLDFLRCALWGWLKVGGMSQYLHRGVTYQSDWKDLANRVEYLYRGAKVVS